MTERVEQTEFYFNVQTGALLVGRLALDAEFESGVHPADISSLPELLAGPERIVGPMDFKPMPHNEWDSQNDVVNAQWQHSVVKQYSPEKVYAVEVVRRAGYLNLNPRYHYFASRPGGLVDLYEEAGLTSTRTRSHFDAWTIADFANLIRRLSRDKGDKITSNELWAASVEPGIPSPNQIAQRISWGELVELAGFYSSRDKTREDLVDWCADFIEANDGKMPTKQNIKLLSKLHHGPSEWTIYDRGFKSLDDFQTEGFIVYQERMQRKKELRRAHLEDIDALLPTDQILYELAATAENEDELIQRYAKYCLLCDFVKTGGSKKEIVQACRAKGTSGLVNLIMRYKQSVNAGEIETQADILGLHDTIWPMDGYLQDLKVA